MPVTNDLLLAATGVESLKFEVEGLDLASGQRYESFISFIDDSHFANTARENNRLKVLLTTEELSANFENSEVQLIIVDDPRWTYFSLQNFIAKKNLPIWESQISVTAVIEPGAIIASTGVVIMDGVLVESGAVVLPYSELHEDCVIRSGAIVGTTGFEHKRTSKGILSVEHDGRAIIGARTEVGANAVVAQGYARRETIIGKDCRLDASVFIAHGNIIGDEVFIAAGAVVAGMCTIGNSAWIGPNATIRDQIHIGEQARVAIGAVVVRDVLENQVVFGNPAKPIG